MALGKQGTRPPILKLRSPAWRMAWRMAMAVSAFPALIAASAFPATVESRVPGSGSNLLALFFLSGLLR